MNIFLHELKAIRRSTFLWTITLIAIMMLFLSIFPGIAKDADAFKRVLEGYPEALRKAFGMSLDNMTTLLGFYIFTFGYILLCSSIQAMNLGTSILSKEIRDKTVDFLLTKPVTRNQIMTSKLLAAAASLIITHIVYLAAACLMVLNIKDSTFDLNIFLLISFTSFFVQLLFLSIGLLLSVLIPKIRSVLSISLGTVFGFYMISLFGSVLGDKVIRYITPFKYFDPAYIMKHSVYENFFIFLEIALLIIICFTSYMIYTKKDIHAV